MDRPENAVAAVLGFALFLFGGGIVMRVVRNALARLHALRSIPLPRQPTLVNRALFIVSPIGRSSMSA